MDPALNLPCYSFKYIHREPGSSLIPEDRQDIEQKHASLKTLIKTYTQQTDNLKATNTLEALVHHLVPLHQTGCLNISQVGDISRFLTKLGLKFEEAVQPSSASDVLARVRAENLHQHKDLHHLYVLWVFISCSNVATSNLGRSIANDPCHVPSRLIDLLILSFQGSDSLYRGEETSILPSHDFLIEILKIICLSYSCVVDLISQDRLKQLLSISLNHILPQPFCVELVELHKIICAHAAVVAPYFHEKSLIKFFIRPFATNIRSNAADRSGDIRVAAHALSLLAVHLKASVTISPGSSILLDDFKILEPYKLIVEATVLWLSSVDVDTVDEGTRVVDGALNLSRQNLLARLAQLVFIGTRDLPLIESSAFVKSRFPPRENDGIDWPEKIFTRARNLEPFECLLQLFLAVTSKSFRMICSFSSLIVAVLFVTRLLSVTSIA